MNGWAERSIEPLLAPSSTAWQPADFLPDAAQPDFLDRVQALRAECTGLPADYWVVLVGDMVTEEALPSYMSMLNRMDGVKDPSGAPRTPLPHHRVSTRRHPYSAHRTLSQAAIRACGRAGTARGQAKRTATATSSTSCSISPAPSTCAQWRCPSSASSAAASTRSSGRIRTGASCTRRSRSVRPRSRTTTRRALHASTARPPWPASAPPSRCDRPAHPYR